MDDNNGEDDLVFLPAEKVGTFNLEFLTEWLMYPGDLTPHSGDSTPHPGGLIKRPQDLTTYDLYLNIELPHSSGEKREREKREKEYVQKMMGSINEDPDKYLMWRVAAQNPKKPEQHIKFFALGTLMLRDTNEDENDRFRMDIPTMKKLKPGKFLSKSKLQIAGFATKRSLIAFLDFLYMPYYGVTPEPTDELVRVACQEADTRHLPSFASCHRLDKRLENIYRDYGFIRLSERLGDD